MISLTLETGLEVLNFSRRTTLGLAEDIPADKWCHQPFPGANHALWILGHLACTDEYFLSNIGGKPTRKLDAWSKTFFMGSKPSPNAAGYPPVAEVREQLQIGREALLAWFRAMDDAALARSLGEEMKNFAATPAALMSTIAWHEGLHAGQLTVIRKSLGLSPKFG